jgi:glycerate 2-kinase
MSQGHTDAAGPARIANRQSLAVTGLREAALAIADAGLEAIDPGAAVRRGVRLTGAGLVVAGEAVPLPAAGGRLLVVAIGKCAGAAAAALSSLLGERLRGGIVLALDDAAPAALGPLVELRGTHPLPSARNVEAAGRIVELLRGAGADDLVLCVVSGGGSVLLCLPPGDGTPEAERDVFLALTRAGATIQEINTVRKHSSLARGGQLARYAHPARVVSLIFSDVPGAPPDFVASGPTLRDATTVGDATRVLARYAPAGWDGAAPLVLVETPKEPRYFERGRVAVLGSNDVALQAMATRAAELGYASAVVTATLAGEARDVGEWVAGALRAAAPRTALLFGGETTVTVRGRGRGGRNLEVALAAARLVGEGEVVVTVASDGRDNGDHAGAVADRRTREAARRLGLDAGALLDDNDSYGFFEPIGDLVVTGPTGANVADLVIALKA